LLLCDAGAEAWLDYCVFYNAPAAEQAKRFGQPLRDISLRQGHSRLTAIAARSNGDPALANLLSTRSKSVSDGQSRYPLWQATATFRVASTPAEWLLPLLRKCPAARRRSNPYHRRPRGWHLLRGKKVDLLFSAT